MNSTSVHIKDAHPQNKTKCNNLKNNRRISSAHRQSSSKKLLIEQAINKSSKKLIIIKNPVQAINSDISQGYDQCNLSPSQRHFDGAKVVQQLFVHRSLNLSQNDLIVQKQEKQQDKINGKNNQVQNSSVSSLTQSPLKQSKTILKEDNFSTLDGKKASEIMMSSSNQNSLHIDVKIFPQKLINQQGKKPLLYKIKQQNVTEDSQNINGNREEDLQRIKKQNPYLQYNSDLIMKLKDQGFGQISNLLDQQKSQARQHEYSSSKEKVSLVKPKTHLTLPENNNFVYQDNIKTASGESIPSHKLNISQLVDNQCAQKNAEHYYGYENKQKLEVSNNYKEYLKSKLQNNYIQETHQDQQICEDEQQRTIKGGIIIGKQLQRARKNTSYGKGISVFENLLLRKQQQQQPAQMVEQKGLNNLHKQNKTNFTQTFYQNLIKQSKRLNSIIKLHEQDSKRKQQNCIQSQIVQSQQYKEEQKGELFLEKYKIPYDELNINESQFKINQISTSPRKLFSSVVDIDGNAKQQTIESHKLNSDEDSVKSFEKYQEQYEDDKESRENRCTNRKQLGQKKESRVTQDGNINKDIFRNTKGSAERPQSQSINRTSVNSDNLALQPSSNGQQYLFNFKKKLNLNINNRDEQLVNDISDSSLYISNNFTDKVIKHFRFASTIKNQSEHRNNLNIFPSQRNSQIQFINQHQSLDGQDIKNQIKISNVLQNKQELDQHQQQRKQSFIVNRSIKYPLPSHTFNLEEVNFEENQQLIKLRQTENLNNLSGKIIPQSANNQQKKIKQFRNQSIISSKQFQSNNNVQYSQQKRQSLQLQILQPSQKSYNKDCNQSAYAITPEKKSSLNPNKKIQNYVSELVNKNSFHSILNDECGPWNGFEEEEGNEVDITH